MKAGLLGRVVMIGLLAAQVALADNVDRYMEDSLRRLHIPGASLAVVRRGKVVRLGGYGLADLESGTPARPETFYEIGSMTKQFTAVAVMMLVGEGKLSLDDSLRRYFPEGPEYWEKITLRHVLHHTSGIRNHVAVPGFMAVFKSDLFFELTPGRDELLPMFYKLPKEFEPGESWSYDNTGYILLGHIIEQVSEKKYFDFLDERIFKPLGMASTRSTDPRPLVRNRAKGYEWTGSGWENRPVLHPGIAFSAGSILSTVGDLAKWDAALSSGKLLSRETLEQMWKPARAADGGPLAFDYGFGWFVDGRDVTHGGGTPGFSSTMRRFNDRGLTVIILTNHLDRVLDHMTTDIAEMIDPAIRRPPPKDADPALTERHRKIFAQYLEGKADPEDFTVPMRIHLGTATGKGMPQWYASNGALGKFELLRIDSDANSKAYRYRVELGGNPYRFGIRVVGGKVAQIFCW